MTTRRRFLRHASLTLGAAALPAGGRAAARPNAEADLEGMIGVTTGSFMRHVAFEPTPGKQRILDLPKVMNGELGMRVLDLMSRTLESFEPAYLEKLRTNAEDNDCLITNLKCNQRGLDMASEDDETRRHAIEVYKESIDAAHRLGCRWIRPIPGRNPSPDRERLVEAFRELIDYGGPKGITLLFENVSWVKDEPDVIPGMIERVGEGLAASPDTGNWADDEVRYRGLAQAYPLAATSDYKVFAFEPDGSHPRYDLKRCFDAGWEAGYRGPWCIEHFDDDLPGLLEGFVAIRDRLRGWIRERSG